MVSCLVRAEGVGSCREKDTLLHRSERMGLAL